jgi:hypothetical protein
MRSSFGPFFTANVSTFAFGEESTMNKTTSRRLGLAAVVVITLVLVVANPSGVRLLHPLTASAAPDQFSGTPFGVSGGNVKDISALFCCSGTLGSLVTDGTTAGLFILSNNHVLARADAAGNDEAISQPGLVDNQCRIPPTVANLTAFPSLSTNVDAAVARLTTGSPMTKGGEINGIGTISSTPKVPSLPMSVQKSGRTTGVTTGDLTSVNTTVRVQYQARCGQGKKFTISFTNQVVVGSSSFSAGGDSGSLILTLDANPRPVALLFAGSSTTTIGNPICEVLAKVSTKFNGNSSSLSFVGTPTLNTSDDCSAWTLSGSTPTQGPSRPHQRANDAKERYADQLMSRPGVIGVGVGNTEDGKGPAVVMYMDANTPGPPFVPAQLDGVPVRVIRTDAFVSR